MTAEAHRQLVRAAHGTDTPVARQPLVGEHPRAAFVSLAPALDRASNEADDEPE